ncbi:uncharacterized protein LAESUDRAFT_747481 [Laetiporus sulphureus 93-53]|uniref:Uncharacterized protein n=1 Tax=Laetiporus sulphureus 93-53 TaxID=1314785 RepID=A0A165GVN4_9APHY|nr:uncharacterized protein LAESUDRAFT_747481 [Laetiporus sulphureus 93-53]KZT10883.1 hypothetical protein LAESUDRAFT_747481 [Laetiporus sulphureus 93-53]
MLLIGVIIQSAFALTGLFLYAFVPGSSTGFSWKLGLPSISSRAGIASDGASFSVSATSSDLATRVTTALTVYNPSPHSSPIPSFQFGVQCPSGVAEPLLPPTLLLFVCAVLVAVPALTGLSSLTFIIFNALPDSDRSKMPELVVDPEGFPLDVELKANGTMPPGPSISAEPSVNVDLDDCDARITGTNADLKWFESPEKTCDVVLVLCTEAIYDSTVDTSVSSLEQIRNFADAAGTSGIDARRLPSMDKSLMLLSLSDTFVVDERPTTGDNDKDKKNGDVPRSLSVILSPSPSMQFLGTTAAQSSLSSPEKLHDSRCQSVTSSVEPELAFETLPTPPASDRTSRLAAVNAAKKGGNEPTPRDHELKDKTFAIVACASDGSSVARVPDVLSMDSQCSIGVPVSGDTVKTLSTYSVSALPRPIVTPSIPKFASESCTLQPPSSLRNIGTAEHTVKAPANAVGNSSPETPCEIGTVPKHVVTEASSSIPPSRAISASIHASRSVSDTLWKRFPVLERADTVPEGVPWHSTPVTRNAETAAPSRSGHTEHIRLMMAESPSPLRATDFAAKPISSPAQPTRSVASIHMRSESVCPEIGASVHARSSALPPGIGTFVPARSSNTSSRTSTAIHTHTTTAPPDANASIHARVQTAPSAPSDLGASTHASSQAVPSGTKGSFASATLSSTARSTRESTHAPGPTKAANTSRRVLLLPASVKPILTHPVQSSHSSARTNLARSQHTSRPPLVAKADPNNLPPRTPAYGLKRSIHAPNPDDDIVLLGDTAQSLRLLHTKVTVRQTSPAKRFVDLADRAGKRNISKASRDAC